MIYMPIASGAVAFSILFCIYIISHFRRFVNSLSEKMQEFLKFLHFIHYFTAFCIYIVVDLHNLKLFAQIMLTVRQCRSSAVYCHNGGIGLDI